MKFEDLEVWKRSARLSADLYRHFAECKDCGFRDQITRAGLSIPSNIAEGLERQTAADKARFLTMANGSCGELRTRVYIGMEIDYIDREQGKRWIQETQQRSAMLVGLSRSLNHKTAP